jgi:hypothetical protein
MAATAQMMYSGLFNRYDPGPFYDEMFTAQVKPLATQKSALIQPVYRFKSLLNPCHNSLVPRGL